MSAISIVKSYYSHFNARNWAGMVDLVSDTIIHEPNQGSKRIGKVLNFQDAQRQLIQLTEDIQIKTVLL